MISFSDYSFKYTPVETEAAKAIFYSFQKRKEEIIVNDLNVSIPSYEKLGVFVAIQYSIDEALNVAAMFPKEHKRSLLQGVREVYHPRTWGRSIPSEDYYGNRTTKRVVDGRLTLPTQITSGITATDYRNGNPDPDENELTEAMLALGEFLELFSQGQR